VESPFDYGGFDELSLFFFWQTLSGAPSSLTGTGTECLRLDTSWIPGRWTVKPNSLHMDDGSWHHAGPAEDAETQRRREDAFGN
jgi:hypothetical protein